MGVAAKNAWKKMPKEEQRKRRVGRENGPMIFNKSKEHPLRKHRSEWKIISPTK
jgi:hypothetical protein